SDKNKQDLLLPFKDVDEVGERFENYREYLGVLVGTNLDLIEDVIKALEEKDRYRFERVGKRYTRRYEKIEEKRIETEKRLKKKFPITEFRKEHDLSKEESTITDLLFAKNGIGINVPDPTLLGEDILACLKILNDTPIEEGRKYLMDTSELIKERKIIGPAGSYTPDDEIEKKKFGISEYAVSKILGEEKRAKEIKEYFDSADGSHPIFSDRDKDEKDGGVLEVLEECIEPNDVVLPSEVKDDIFATVEQQQRSDKFYEEWGMKEITGDKAGVSLLFAGASGTGKTMMAKAVGTHLDKNVYHLKCEDMMSSWYGKTEKNVKEMFEALNDEEPIIVIDEAEGILSKRHGSTDAASATEDRIVDIFLREMENHDGILVFTTNYSIALDKALSRRFDLKVKFPRPDKEARLKIWENHIPESLPLADDVDLEELAKRYEINGGNIKNAILYAARTALSEGRETVSQEDLVIGIESEEDDAMDYSLHSDEEGRDNLGGVDLYG
ncbi:MAG: ATP-binding protein, partial [Candidatus Natronoplasma sp.]